MNLKSRASRKAVTLVEFMVAIAVLGLILAVSVPPFMRSRAIQSARTCQENLARLDSAKERYFLEHKDARGSLAMADLISTGSEFGNMAKLPVCPSGGTYSFSPGNETPLCSVGKNQSAAYAPHVFSTELPLVRKTAPAKK